MKKKKEISSRENSKCKGPEMEVFLACLMYSTEASVVRTDWSEAE